jgi:putative ABC transport system substrate-binding protein
MEILKETVLNAVRIGVLGNPIAPAFRPASQAAAAAGGRLGVEIHMLEVRTVQDLGKAFASLTEAGVGGVFVVSSTFIVNQAGPLAELMLKHRLPSMFGARENVEAGGLMSYAPDFDELYRRSAIYIDKILRGAKPADLPVEQASKYQLTINLRTAKALGLTIPPSVLARADEIIQ